MSLVTDVHTDLWKIAGELRKKINRQSTPDEIRVALQREFREVTHRLNMIAGAQLARELASLQRRAEKVRGAQEELTGALRDVETVTEVVKAVTKFLTAVDSFIDAAKPLFL